ncbi:PspC domain-containing protein [Pedobacter arcticus]|uniref:PspC domain-containing protein n=1 Tax=Pedobacter arcticus TaxID=752140 RepID=UPI0002D9B658|nr:PspC domain-containing protein [Pedobacter arcticus]
MEKKLTRDPQEKMIAGVAAGIAKYFQLDVTWVRIAFALATFFGGSGLWIYIILWIVVPEDFKSPFSYTDYRTESEGPIKPIPNEKNSSKLSLLLGFLLIVMGAYFLMGEFDLLPYWFKLRKLWPLIFIVFGLMILAKAKKNNEPVDRQPVDEKPIEDEATNTDTEQPNQQ